MTEEESEICPDCGAVVFYADDGVDDGEPECECVYEEDDAEVQSMDEVAAMMRERGQEWRHWDPSYYPMRVSNHRYSDRQVFVQKATLGQIARIERLRWKTCLNWQKHCHRDWKLREEIANLGECFIPADPEDVANAISRRKERGEELTEEDLERIGRSTRYVAKRRVFGDGVTTHFDHEFWNYDEPKHNGTEMEVIAAATHLGEWEQEILPDRIRRSEDPAKLDLGRRYAYEESLGRGRAHRRHFLDQLLTTAITMSSVLPEGQPYIAEVVNVQINGRSYPFEVGPHSTVTARYKEWPRPDSPPAVIVPECFELDKSLIGLKSEAVRTRLGEPERIEGVEWHYPEGAVVFNNTRFTAYDCSVVKVERVPAGVAH